MHAVHGRLTAAPVFLSVAGCQIKSEGVSSSSLTAEQLKQVPVRAYLDQTVVPLLMQGMSELVKVRSAQHHSTTATPQTQTQTWAQSPRAHTPCCYAACIVLTGLTTRWSGWLLT